MDTNPTRQSVRLDSVDTYRGLVMLLMMAEVLKLSRLSEQVRENSFWDFLAYHQTHITWAGCTVHDMIQPSFSLLVGVSLPFSLAARRARGDSTTQLFWHAAWRALLLVFLGIWLRSIGKGQTNFTFDDTLTQIGLGYLPLFLLALAAPRVWWIALGVILIGYWTAFAVYPLPGPDFDWESVNVLPGSAERFSGFAEHWSKNSNIATAFDQWWMNLFPRSGAFKFQGSGYTTLSFIPTLGTMLLGLIAGARLRSAVQLRKNNTATAEIRGTDATASETKDRPEWPVTGWLLATGAILIAASLLLHYAGICPIVKKIWTPAWVLFSGGVCYWILAIFYAVIDVRGYRRWTLPLRVIGMNSIAAYVMAHLFESFLLRDFRTHLPASWIGYWGTDFEPVVLGALALAVYWLILWWMYRRKLFLKI
ncbi:MAG: DUF5009 domain-containing protein [Planctomycetota bacterium]|nr:DUF5009 domain-containing protein [Planctomycetota bacterium]